MTTDRTEAVSSTQSVLDMMTNDIVNRKNDKKTGLTPVGLEGRTIPVLPMATDASFPNDHPVEVVVEAIRMIRYQMAQIEGALAAVEAFVGGQAADSQPPLVDPVKAKEAAADEKQKAKAAAKAAPAADAEAEYDAAVSVDLTASVVEAEKNKVLKRLDRLATEAQAATFVTPSQPIGDTPNADTGVASAGWVCPDHGEFVIMRSRKGREYRGCNEPGCSQFERL